MGHRVFGLAKKKPQQVLVAARSGFFRESLLFDYIP